MKLKNKLLISQIVVFLIMFTIFTVMLPNIIYISSGREEIESAMILNEQIMMRMERCFDELERFTAVVADDNDLNKLLRQYLSEPTEQNAAKIRLYLSGMGRNDRVPSYRVLGIYLNISHGEEEYVFNTVGLAESVKVLANDVVLPRKELEGKETMFVEPFTFARGESTTVFGSRFLMGYGFAKNYNKNDISGNVIIIASYDEIIYIARDVGDYCKDFLLLTGNDVKVVPSVEDSGIEVDKVTSSLVYGDSYLEGYLQGDQGIIVARFSENGSWKLFCKLTRQEIISNNKYLIFMNVLLIAIFGICVAVIMMPLVNKFVGPLGEVSRQMGEIAKGNLNARVLVKARDEIGEASESFNIMAEKLEDNISELIEKEKLEHKMRYSLLVSHMDPHFIYNTMNTITYLAQRKRTDEVISVNRAMIEILRDRLRIEISEIYDTIAQEISVTEQYLIIQSYRYECVFKSKVFVSRGMEHYLIAKNMIQPLVENALIHGILENKDENGEILGGCIEIMVIRDGKYIVVTVKDNGAGMSEEQLSKIINQPRGIIRGEHIGIRNIRERIQYIYGESFNLAFWSRLGEGTEVTVRLPVIQDAAEAVEDKMK